MKKLIILFTLLLFANASFGAITLTPTTIDAGYCQHAYSCKVTATGGRAPYAYTISVGTLPAGLFISKPTGVISGTINLTRDTTISFTVKATDALIANGTRAYTMTITNKVVTWATIWPSFNRMPNTYPDNGETYDAFRLYASGASITWNQGGNTVTSIKKLGTIDNLDLPVITNNIERARFYANGNGFNVTKAYYLAGSKLIYFPADASGNLSIGAGAGNTATESAYNTNVGALSSTANTTGEDNVAIGYSSQRYTTTGGNNTSVGSLSLTTNTTGVQNTAIGKGSLTANTTGIRNTSTGYLAMASNTTGADNTAYGVGSLNANTTASFNTGIGKGTLGVSTTGASNTAIGYNAMVANTTGALNTSIGYTALSSNTTGDNNVAVGVGSLASSISGASNSAIGYNALQNTTGGTNTAFGSYAGAVNTSGGGNTFIGSGAYANDATASYNTIVGATNNAITGSNNIAISDGQGVVRLLFNSAGALTLTGPAVTAKAAEPSTHVLTVKIGADTYYLLMTNVAP